MSMDTSSPARWLAGILFTVIFASLSWLTGVVLRHEGDIGRWDGQLGVIQRTLERLENKVDTLQKGK